MQKAIQGIIGRKEETKELNTLYDSGKAEFVVVYGRRRVGKTFLVNETFKGQFAFTHSGLSPAERRDEVESQLHSFQISLIKYGFNDCPRPETWLDAFFLLEQLLEQKDTGERQVVFIDEMPWLDSPRSGFLTAFESFWNSWGCGRRNLMLIICGSATSWMTDKLINNYGGLYNRITYQILLLPFTLKETAEFFKMKGLTFSDVDIAEAYMAVGGVPYYLDYFQKGMSIAENIDNIYFAPKAHLKNEFDRLFKTLFSKDESYKEIVRLLATKHSGFTRNEIMEKLKIKSGNGLTTILNTLSICGFIQQYIPVGNNKRQRLYRLADFFCRFHLRFIDRVDDLDPHFWRDNINMPTLNAWRGICFEELCMTHIEQIKRELGISGMSTAHSSMLVEGSDTRNGAQLDLVIQRKDRVINLCEMKFTATPFTIDRKYQIELNERIESLREKLHDQRSNILLTFITSSGVRKNEYSGMVQREVGLEALIRY